RWVMWNKLRALVAPVVGKSKAGSGRTTRTPRRAVLGAEASPDRLVPAVPTPLNTTTECASCTATATACVFNRAMCVDGTHGDGGPGSDTLVGGGASDTISVGNDASTNTVYGGDGGDLIIGGPGTDYVSGGNGNDAIYGNGGTDYLGGDAGDDYIDGGTGEDYL